MITLVSSQSPSAPFLLQSNVNVPAPFSFPTSPSSPQRTFKTNHRPPLTEPTNNIRIMLLNVQGFINFDAAIDLALQSKATVVVLTETWLTTHSEAIYLNTLGFQVVALNRPHRVTSGRTGGGVMVISLTNHIVVRSIRASPTSGVLSVSLSTSTSAPSLLTCCYVAGKSTNDKGISSTEDAHKDIVTHAELSSQFHEHFILGDFNASIGKHMGRNTMCNYKVDVRSQNLISLLNLLDHQALHGRTSPALTTSRLVSASADSIPKDGGKEVDFIFTKGETSASPVNFFPSSFWPSFTSHRPLLADIKLLPIPRLPKKARAKAATRSKLAPPPFGDSVYKNMAPSIIAYFRERNACPEPSSLTVISKVLVSIATDYMREKENDLCIFRRSQNPHRDRQRSLASGKHSPLIPLDIAIKLKRANSLYWKSVCEEKRGLPFFLTRQAARKLQHEARQHRALHLLRFHSRLKHLFELQRRRDPKRLFRAHGKLSPSSGAFDSSLPAGPDLCSFQTTLEHVYQAQPVPPAVGKCFPNAPQALPTLLGYYLGRLISWEEVHHVLFPNHKNVPCHICPEAVRAECKYCLKYDWGLEKWTGKDDSPHPPPQPHPHLSSSTAAGRDGLPAQAILWPLAGHRNKLEHRKDVCSVLARTFSHHLALGEAPSSMREMKSIPILKELKPGQARDIHDIPKSYRFLTIGNVLGKVFEMVIFARIYHWAMRASLIGPENIGGLTGMGVEHHIFTLRELIRHDWRKDNPEPLFVFFVDFHKAYDNVHPTLIVKLLQHMGIPDNLARLLSSIYTNTTTTLHVGREISDVLNLHSGLGQGRVLSSLLFVLFLESYLRTIKSTPGLEGISIKTRHTKTSENPTVSNLGYIDDVVVPLRFHQLKLFFEVTLAWSKDWGMPVSLGAGKTEILPLIPPSLRSTVTLPDEITVNGHTVLFTNSYKYLGYHMDRVLDDCDRQQLVLNQASREFYTKIYNVMPVRDGPPLTIIQFFKTFVMSIASNLASVFIPSAHFCAAIDELALKAARLALPGCTHSTPTPILLRMTGLVPFEFIALLHRIRLFLFLTNPANANCLSSQLYRLLEEENHRDSWYGETQQAFRKLGVDPATLTNHSLNASIVSRFIAFQCANNYFDGLLVCHRSDFISPQALSYPPILRLPSLGEYCSGRACLLASCNDPSIPRAIMKALVLSRRGREFFLHDYMPHCLELYLSTAFPSPSPSKNRALIKCSVCHLTGHNKLTCPRKDSPLGTTCSKCRRKGHDKDECNNAAPTPLYSSARITVFGRLKSGSSPCPLSGCMSETPLSAHHILICTNGGVMELRNTI